LFLIATTATFTMGLTWAFGFLLIFTRNDLLFDVIGWLFAILSSLQVQRLITVQTEITQESRNLRFWVFNLY